MAKLTWKQKYVQDSRLTSFHSGLLNLLLRAQSNIEVACYFQVWGMKTTYGRVKEEEDRHISGPLPMILLIAF